MNPNQKRPVLFVSNYCEHSSAHLRANKHAACAETTKHSSHSSQESDRPGDDMDPRLAPVPE